MTDKTALLALAAKWRRLGKEADTTDEELGFLFCADELEQALAEQPAGAVGDPADWPECSGNPGCCPENEGYGCCKPNSEAVEDQPPRGFIKVRDAARGVVSVNKVFPGDIIAEEYDTRPSASVVDEAMVERAEQAYEREVIAGATHEQAWHVALTKALAAPRAEQGNEAASA